LPASCPLLTDNGREFAQQERILPWFAPPSEQDDGVVNGSPRYNIAKLRHFMALQGTSRRTILPLSTIRTNPSDPHDAIRPSR
jgi:hypothetical protein